MAYSNFSNKRKVPTKVSTRKSEPITTNFAKGVYTYKPNDTMTQDEIRLAENARFDRVGEYGTRKGFSKLLIAPIGTYSYASNQPSMPALTPGDEVIKYTYTATQDGTISHIGFMICKKTGAGYVVPRVNLTVRHTQPGASSVKTYSSCLNDSDLYVGALADAYAYFMEAPSVKNGDSIEVQIDTQNGVLSDLIIGTVDQADKHLAATIYGCTPGSVSNIFESNINGYKSIFFTFDGKLYWRSAAGSIATIRTLPAGVSKVRFCQNLNTVRYVDGKEAPHLLTPTINGSGVITTWTDTAITPTDLKTGTTLSLQMSNIMNGTADNLVYFAVDPDTEAVWTYPYGYTYAKSPSFTTTATISGSVGTTLSVNISTISPSGIAVGDWITGQGTGTATVTSISGSTVNLRIVDTTPQTISSYDKFSTDFYQNFPAIKTGDPLTAMFNLGGVLYFMTRRNKYMMYAQTAESWSQSASNAQSGTFSQESLVCDLNYAYYANDKGIYIFDGSSEASLTEKNIQNVYDAIPNKESIVLDLFNNRLYVFYASEGSTNDHCLVYNTNLRIWESFDSDTYVSASCGRQSPSNSFYCGHSKIGMIMVAENGSYSDMGTPIAFNLETSYLHFGSTSQLKRITKWRPEFATTESPYTIECGYSLDFDDQVHYAFSIDLQRQVPVMTDYVWDNPSDYGVPAIPTKHTALTRVNGEFYRCQIRYQHIAAFEPVIFRSHTLTVQTQRIR